MSKIKELRKAIKDILESLEKRAPKGVDPKKHESCVIDVKAKGHDVGSAHAICTSSMKKDEHDVCKYDTNGQWKIEKSNYGPKGMGQYSSVDNIRRKASRTGEELEHVGQNKGVRQYTTVGSSVQAAHEVNEAKARKAKPAPVKTLKDFSDDELAEITNASNKMKKAEKGEPIKTCSCGMKLTTSNAKYVGEQELPEGYPGKMYLYNCPKCDSTVAHMKDK